MQVCPDVECLFVVTAVTVDGFKPSAPTVSEISAYVDETSDL